MVLGTATKRLWTQLGAHGASDSGTDLVGEGLLKYLHFGDTLIVIVILACFILFTLFSGHFRGFMLLSALALLPELIALVSLLSNVKDSLVRVLTHLAWSASLAATPSPSMRTSLSLSIPSTGTAPCVRIIVIVASALVLLHGGGRLMVDMDDHSWALVPIVRRLKLLQDERRVGLALIPIPIQKAFLHEVKALARFCLVLLSDVLWRVAEAGLLEEVEFGALVEARVAVVLVRVEQLHGLLVAYLTQFVELVDRVTLEMMLRLLLLHVRCGVLV